MGIKYFSVIVVVLLIACSNQSKEDLLNSGVGYLREGNAHRAIVCLKSALEIDPDYLAAHYSLGDAYLQTGQYQLAEREFDKIYHKNTTYSDVRVKLAQVYRHTDRLDQSIEYIEAFHQDNQPSSQSLDLLGAVHLLKQQFQLADSLFQEAAELDSENPLPRFHLAYSYLGQSRNQDAGVILERMLDDFQGFTPAYELLAELNLSQKRVGDAIETYRRLFVVDPNNAHALYLQGLLLLTLNGSHETREVVALFDKRFPNDYRAKQLLGIEAYNLNQFSDAQVLLRLSLKMQPEALTHYYLGLSHFTLKEYELAVSQYQRVLDAQPDSSQARLMLAMTFLIQKRFEDCSQQIRFVLKVDPDNELAYHLLGNVYVLQKEYDKALTAFNHAMDIAPGLIDVHLEKSRSYALAGETDLAERELTSALTRSSQILNTRLLLGNHQNRLNSFNIAASRHEGAVSSPPDTFDYTFLADTANRR